MEINISIKFFELFIRSCLCLPGVVLHRQFVNPFLTIIMRFLFYGCYGNAGRQLYTAIDILLRFLPQGPDLHLLIVLHLEHKFRLKLARKAN